jgi:regulator of nonsense transcripts 3
MGKQGLTVGSAAKPSRPARVYIHVTKPEHVAPLGDRVRESTFHDTAKSWQDSALVGPPTLEYAPYPKMPGGRRRNDNRQGTIDQDQEFKDFLESLTNPITKSAAPEDAQKHEKVKTTPLIEALREKKANKDKPSNKANRQGRGEGKDDAADKKTPGKQGKENALSAGDKNRRISKADKAAKDAVKILNKEAASSKDSSTTAEKPAATPTPERKRGNVAGVKSLLQRDLGLATPANRRRGTKREVASAAADVHTKDTATTTPKPKDAPASVAGPSIEKTTPQSQKKERPTRAERRAFKASLTDKSNDKSPANDAKAHAPTKSAPAPAPQILKKPQPAQTPAAKDPATTRQPPTGPAAGRTIASPAQAAVKPAVAPAPPVVRAAPANPVPSPTSKQAFLKHANPSQGITEPLIEETLKAFGGIEKVEIDKRKGFAYVDFSGPEGLQKAMAASPIKIAQGAVQVLERKEKVARGPLNPRFNGPPPTGPARGGRGGFVPRGGRGGRGGARGGGHVIANSSTGSSDATPAASTITPTPATAPPGPVASADPAT